MTKPSDVVARKVVLRRDLWDRVVLMSQALREKGITSPPAEVAAIVIASGLDAANSKTEKPQDEDHIAEINQLLSERESAMKRAAEAEVELDEAKKELEEVQGKLEKEKERVSELKNDLDDLQNDIDDLQEKIDIDWFSGDLAAFAEWCFLQGALLRDVLSVVQTPEGQEIVKEAYRKSVPNMPAECFKK